MNRRNRIELANCELVGQKKRKNLCIWFILPMCGINHKTLPDNFDNCYVTKEYEVIVSFDKTHDYNSNFLQFMEFIKTKSKFYTKYQEDEDEILLFFKISKVFEKDFDLFLDGKYSKFSSNLKSIITKFFGVATADGWGATWYDAISAPDFKKKKIVELLDLQMDWKSIKEVLDKPDLNKEIYKELAELLKEQKEETTI